MRKNVEKRRFAARTVSRRTERMMKTRFRQSVLVLTVAAILLSLALPAGAASEFKATCDQITADVGEAIVYDMTNNTILYEKNADKSITVASITKVLNACVAVQYFNANDALTVGDEVYLTIPEASRAGVYPGQRFTFEQLLHAMLLPSGCDVAYVFAAAVGRKAAGDNSLSIREAVRMGVAEMNRFLERLGCTESHFTNPDGQDDSNQYTTCRDYIRVLRYAVEHPLISSVIRKAGYSCTDLNGNGHYWETTNGMVAEDSYYYYPGAKGIKTGTTPNAGCCLSVAAERNGRTLISLVVNANSISDRYTVSTALLDAAFAVQPEIEVVPVVRLKGDVNGDGSVTPADARLTLRISVWLETPGDYDLRYADMDKDGYVTPADARLVLRVSIGLEETTGI